jgi:predicted dehydrogenase
LNRRHFLLGPAAIGLTLNSRALGAASDRVRVACVGVRGQGRAHIAHYAKMQNVEIAALCDIDESVLNARLSDVEKLGHKRPAAFTDFRKLLEDKSIDAVSIATPNHNHTLQAIWACQAGKDVYVEKPCSHDMFEARQIAVVMEKYGRVVQHGTNSRSGIAREAVQKIRPMLQVA